MKTGSDFFDGVRDVLPILPPIAAIASVTGVEAAVTGFNPFQVVLMSVSINSPSVVLAALKLLDTGTPAIIVVFTSLFVGIRFMMLSISLSPYLKDLSRTWKWILAYFLWTAIYALSIIRFTSESSTNRKDYYLGAAVPMWFTIHSSVIIGTIFGARLTAEIQLDFVATLAFIALLVRLLKNRVTSMVVLIAGIFSVMGAGLPLNSGIIIAVLISTMIGSIISRRRGI